MTGSQVVAWVSASSFQLRPQDLTTFPVAALVEDGAGGYTTIAGTGHADCTFTIDGVPDGAYWLRVPDAVNGVAYHRTTASAVDAGFTAQGRPDAVAVTAPASLVLDVTDLAPWQAGDQVEMFSSENFSWYFDSQVFATAGVPAVGATALSGYTFDLSRADAGTPHVIDGARVPPDRFVVAQTGGSATTRWTLLCETPTSVAVSVRLCPARRRTWISCLLTMSIILCLAALAGRGNRGSPTVG